MSSTKSKQTWQPKSPVSKLKSYSPGGRDSMSMFECSDDDGTNNINNNNGDDSDDDIDFFDKVAPSSIYSKPSNVSQVP
jgi:hypothetical protein